MAIRFLDEEEPRKTKVRFLDEPSTAEEAGIGSGLGALAAGRRLVTDPMETARQPRATAETGLQLAQTAGQIAFPYLSAPVTGATEYGIQRVRGSEHKQAAQEAAVAGSLDLLLTGAGVGISKAVKPLLKKAIPAFTGISEESTELALKKPSIFKGKLNLEKTFNKLGTKAQNAANYIQKEAGKAVGAEKEALRGLKIKFNFDDIAKNIDDFIKQKQFGRETVLSVKDIDKINSFSNKIRTLGKGKGMGADELYAVKKQMDDLVKFDPQVVKKIGSEAEGILKQTSKQIAERLGNISPKFKKVSKKYAEILNLRNDVLPKLKRTTAGTNVKNIFKRGLATEEPVSFLEEFKQLDKLAPAKYKFAEEANEALVRQQFEHWVPKSSTLRNIRLASFTAGGVGGYVGKTPILVGAAALGAATTPKTYKGIIKGGSALKRAMAKPIARGTARQTVTRISDLLLGGNK